MIQAATIGQTFAVLSGVSDLEVFETCANIIQQDARHLALAESFHGTVIAVTPPSTINVQ